MDMLLHAIVDESSGTVTSVALWNGVNDWRPSPGEIAVPCDEHVGIGDHYDGSAFSRPAPPVEAENPLLAVTGRQIIGQIQRVGIANVFLQELADCKAQDALYWSAVSMDTVVPVDNPKIGRLLTAAGVKDVAGFLQAASELPG